MPRRSDARKIAIQMLYLIDVNSDVPLDRFKMRLLMICQIRILGSSRNSLCQVFGLTYLKLIS